MVFGLSHDEAWHGEARHGRHDRTGQGRSKARKRGKM